jgi:tRNA(fMet)-specific endonuclease VapC
MLYLLDSDTIILMLRGLKAPARQQARREKALAIVARCQRAQSEDDSVAVSAVTVSELEFGARNSDNYEAEIIAVHKTLAPFEVLGYDGQDCPPHYGRIRHELEQAGVPIGAMDLLIAAHALAVSATVVTNNVAHFGRVGGLTVVKWP